MAPNLHSNDLVSVWMWIVDACPKRMPGEQYEIHFLRITCNTPAPSPNVVEQYVASNIEMFTRLGTDSLADDMT